MSRQAVPVPAVGGGMLVSEDGDFIAHARKLATQARDPAPHYQREDRRISKRVGSPKVLHAASVQLRWPRLLLISSPHARTPSCSLGGSGFNCQSAGQWAQIRLAKTGRATAEPFRGTAAEYQSGRPIERGTPAVPSVIRTEAARASRMS
jgi:hypothetical protein